MASATFAPCEMTCRALLDFPGQHDFNSR